MSTTTITTATGQRYVAFGDDEDMPNGCIRTWI
jgi:hypothetical protein